MRVGLSRHETHSVALRCSSPANRGRTRSGRWCWHWALEKAIWSCYCWATSVHPASRLRSVARCCKATCRLPISATVLLCPRIKVLLPICSSCFTLWSSLMNQYDPGWCISMYIYAVTTKTGWFARQNHPIRSNFRVAHPRWRHLQCLAGPKLPESLLDAINGIIAQVLVLSSVSWFSWSFMVYFKSLGVRDLGGLGGLPKSPDEKFCNYNISGGWDDRLPVLNMTMSTDN